jgi:hypothetical protein
MSSTNGIIKSSSASQTPKRCSFKKDLARDLETGEEVPQSEMHSSEYRAMFQDRRRMEQECRKQADRAYQGVIRRLEARAAASRAYAELGEYI